MKVDRRVLVVLAIVIGAMAVTGCKSPNDQGAEPGDTAAGEPAQPTASGASDAPADGSGARATRRHRGRHGRHGHPRRGSPRDHAAGSADQDPQAE